MHEKTKTYNLLNVKFAHAFSWRMKMHLQALC
jgi:hypothetical protein